MPVTRVTGGAKVKLSCASVSVAAPMVAESAATYVVPTAALAGQVKDSGAF